MANSTKSGILATNPAQGKISCSQKRIEGFKNFLNTQKANPVRKMCVNARKKNLSI
jgi:hypothetical protein